MVLIMPGKAIEVAHSPHSHYNSQVIFDRV